MTTIWQRRLSDWIHNPLIKDIAHDNRWTVSLTKNKMPIDFKHFQKTGEIKGAKTTDNHSPYVDLPSILETIDQNRLNEHTNITLKLNAEEDHLCVLDIEPHCPDVITRVLLYDFPHQYGEFSTHGGLHLLTKIKDDHITLANRYLLNEQAIKDQEQAGDWEVLFNQHVTFTRYQFKTNLDQDADRRQKVFLNRLVDIDKKRKERREKNRSFTHLELDENGTDKSDDLLDYIDYEGLKYRVQQLDPDNYQYANKSEVDQSRYEAACMSRILQTVLRAKEIITQNKRLSDQIGNITNSDLIMTGYRLSKDLLTHREKHDEQRVGIPYLLYQTRNLLPGAIEYREEREATSWNASVLIISSEPCLSTTSKCGSWL